MKFNHLNVPTHWRNYWSRYPEGHTILEALISWVSQVDNMVDNVNSWNAYLDNFVATFDKELQQTVTNTLSDWQTSGFLDVVISEALQWELDTYIATNEQDKVLINERFTNELHMSDFPRLAGEVDDTGRLQRAIDYFDGNIAGSIHIAEDLRISEQVTCNKTGLRLVGVTNRKSRIICTHGGIGLFIKPLYNGVPYTSISYCKFYMDNIAVVAEGEATVSGTGLWLQWIYASSFTNLYTSGFAKHIVLKGAHLNTFYNLYQGNKDTTVQTLEIHNRGVGLCADYATDETGESTSNNNHIVGGWINNCHWDLTGLHGTITSLVDIEPASNTFLLGDSSVFKDCRFERMNIYTQEPYNLYPNFPWFILSNNCRIINCNLNQSGASSDTDNPIFQIDGNFNEIEIDNYVPYNRGLISFSPTAKANIIIYKGLYEDYQHTLFNDAYKTENVSIQYNNQKNRFIYKDNLEGTITDVVGSHTKANGEFICRNSKNTNIVNVGDYGYEGLTSEAVDIPLPIGREIGSTAFTKLTLTTGDGNRRMYLAPANGQTVSKAGVYTLTATVYIPSTSSRGIEIGATLNAFTRIDARDQWVTVRSRVYLNEGEKIIPTFQSYGIQGDVYYIGEISVCEGNTSVYIPNDTYEAVSASF